MARARHGQAFCLRRSQEAEDDPRGMAKDVSGLGRWGNGDVEVRLESLSELPYVMGLVRQSLERQLGDEIESE